MARSVLDGALELRERSREKSVRPPCARSELLAAQPSTLRPSPPRARVRRAALLGVILLLAGVPRLFAQGRTGTISLTMQVRPEELLQNQNGSVVLKIRLARGTTAHLWAASSCTSPSQASQVITLSGMYSIPLTAFAPASGSTSPMRVCLASTDGVLNDSLPVELLGSGNSGVAPQIAPNSTSFDLPVGWVETVKGRTKTWSSP